MRVKLSWTWMSSITHWLIRSQLQSLNEDESSQDQDHVHVQSPLLTTLERILVDISGIHALQGIVEENLIGVLAVAYHLHLTGTGATITVVEAIHLLTEDIEIDHQGPILRQEEAVTTLVNQTKLLRLAKYIVDRFKK